MPVNDTIRRFGYPTSLVADFEHWLVLLRPSQPTLGSLVLAARGDAAAFGDLPDGAHSELKVATRAIEAVLKRVIDYDRINYLMLMMVDPHVHFHVIPRYEGERELDGLAIGDSAWPGPPDLKAAVVLDEKQLADLAGRFVEEFARV